jgi:outer membrane protein assembly factor BamB
MLTTLVLAQAIAWQWAGAAAPNGMYQAPRIVRAGTVECTFMYEDKLYKARTSCAQNGRELWQHTEANAFVDDAALVIDAGTLYSARHSDISSGCTLHAFDVQTGREKWVVALTGLGPIAHSKYFNLVQARMMSGRVAVFGWEAAGRYVEVRDASTGAMISHALVP